MIFYAKSGSYKDDRCSFILQDEENGAFHLAPCNDGTGWSTIGVGFSFTDTKSILLKKFYIVIICVAFMSPSISNATAQPKICTDIHKSLIQRQQGHEPKGFYIEYREQDGEDSYQGLDIDGDKIEDIVMVGCGASIDSLCHLTVILSTGENYEFVPDKRFFLARLKSSIYIIAGESLSEKEKNKRGKRQIYQLTKRNVKLICSHL